MLGSRTAGVNYKRASSRAQTTSRSQGVTIQVPPLCERAENIPSLVKHFLVIGDIAAHPDRFEIDIAETHCRQGMSLAKSRCRRSAMSGCHVGLGSCNATYVPVIARSISVVAGARIGLWTLSPLEFEFHLDY
jgi:hypothetical protein